MTSASGLTCIMLDTIVDTLQEAEVATYWATSDHSMRNSLIAEGELLMHNTDASCDSHMWSQVYTLWHRRYMSIQQASLESTAAPFVRRRSRMSQIKILYKQRNGWHGMHRPNDDWTSHTNDQVVLECKLAYQNQTFWCLIHTLVKQDACISLVRTHQEQHPVLAAPLQLHARTHPAVRHPPSQVG